MFGIIGTHHHVRFHPRCFRTYGEQLPAMEEIDVANGRQVFLMGVYGGSDSFHAAKIQYFSDIMT